MSVTKASSQGRYQSQKNSHFNQGGQGNFNNKSNSNSRSNIPGGTTTGILTGIITKDTTIATTRIINYRGEETYMKKIYLDLPPQ